MEATFDRGDSERPRGHALCFFRAADDASRLFAVYIIVSPVTFDIGKYLPPILAGQVSQFEIGAFAAVALPPIPEEVGDAAHLRSLAGARDDDLLDAGALPADGPAAALPRVQDVVQWYRSLYERYIGGAITEGEPTAGTEIDADEILYGVLGNRERLAELSKLIGSLRYAHEVQDGGLVQSSEERMRKLARFLPVNYRARELVDAARGSDPRATRLAELLLQRCFKLVEEDYAAVGELDRQIAAV